MAGEALRQKAREKATGEASTEVATAEDKPASIAQFLDQLAPQLQRALPRHMSGDRLARIALTQVRLQPKLAACNPHSFAGALLTAAQLGLEPHVNGEAYLVPYGRECQLIIGYQGYAKLFWQHPLARHLDAQTVFEKDEFDWALGLNPYLTHKPARGDRGKPIYYYAVVALTTGASEFVVLTPEEVKELRGKEGPNGGIKDPMRWMERKTPLRQLAKLIPKSPSLALALEADERVGSELHARLPMAGELPPAAEQPETQDASVPGGVDLATGEYDPTTESDYQPEGATA
jgi:recombination protein RecT